MELGDVFLKWVYGRDKKEDDSKKNEGAGNEEYGGGFPHIAINLSLCIPVGRYLLRHLGIEIEAKGEG